MPGFIIFFANMTVKNLNHLFNSFYLEVLCPKILFPKYMGPNTFGTNVVNAKMPCWTNHSEMSKLKFSH